MGRVRVDGTCARCFTVHVANKKRQPVRAARARNGAVRRAAGRRSQEEAERTRTRILDRAERLFSRRGYRGVSLRELSRACGVQPFTIQHHFGSKPGLYQAVLSRWDEEILARVGAVVSSQADLATTVEKVVEELFDFFLEKRGWVALSVRATLGEGLAKGVSLKEQSWVQFIDRTLADQQLGPSQHDLGLLLITVEGILHHHILSTAHYKKLFGRDLSDPRIRERTKQHLQRVILSLVESGR